MAGPDDTRKVPVFPGMIEVIMRIVVARVMPDPMIVFRMHMRELRMSELLAGARLQVLRRTEGSRPMRGDVSTAHAVLSADSTASVLGNRNT
jgi:hypothetical protein